MRVGFLDAKSNSKDAYPIFVEIAQKNANVSVEHLSAPNPFKIPAAAKKLFHQGVDAIIAFVTSDEEHELAFLRDKIADVEMAEARYVFLVMEDTRVLEPQLRQDLEHALSEALEYAPPEAPAAPAGAMDMFSQPVEHEEEDVKELLEDSEVHKLF